MHGKRGGWLAAGWLAGCGYWCGWTGLFYERYQRSTTKITLITAFLIDIPIGTTPTTGNMASFVKTGGTDTSTSAEVHDATAKDTPSLPVPMDKGKEEEPDEDEDEDEDDSAETEAERLCQGKEEDGKEYLVVVETYPTNTGSYSGMHWSELELYRRTDVRNK